MLIYDPNGTRTPLGQKLGGGSEAEIFDIDDQPQLVAKIYRNPTRYRESKLQAMIANPPRDPTLHLGHPSICWPKSLLFNEAGTCVGFSMHRVDISTHVPAFKLYNPQDRQGVSVSITWKYLVRAATNIAAAVEAIHAQGHVIGDFNESNILVANSALVTLVDCDSMQISDAAQGVCFRCPVGRPDFTPPELQGCEFAKIDRCFAHDNFGLGIMIFLLLMEGIHPFSGVWRGKGNPPVLEERIRGGISPYAGHPDVTTLPAAPSTDLVPMRVTEMFVRCFKDGHADPSLRPAPSEWKAALSVMEENLTECAVSARHIFGNHLAACPWCQRKVILGGIDPFPLQVQSTAGKHPPVANIPGRIAHDIRNLLQSWGRFGAFLLSRPLRRIAVALGLLLVCAILWGIVRDPLRRLWSFADAALTSFLIPQPRLQLSAPLLCTGLDSQGVPVGVAESFSQDQLKRTGLMVFLTYTGAVPQKTKFLMRLTINGKVLESSVNTFEKKADFLHIRLGNDLPVGNHKIEFLVDGTVLQSASIVIEAGSAVARARSAPKRITSTTQEPPPVAEVTPVPLPLAPTSVPIQPQSASHETALPAQAPAKSVTYRATHWHGLGSCTGELRLTPRSIEFTSEQHTFKFDISEVHLDNDGIKDPSDKAWHFFIEGIKVEQMLGTWMRGELFPESVATGERLSEAANQDRAVVGESAQLRIYQAKHKHLLGSCSGELRLTPEAIEFSSPQHSFKYELKEVQVERDGIRDRNGRNWQFDIPGEDAADLLRAWKSGKIFGK